MDLHTLVQAWNLPEPITFCSTTQGYFNITNIVDTPAGRSVLRIYLNGSDVTRLRHEQDLMTRLQAAGLPFAVPAPVPARSGDMLVRAERVGPTASAALIPFIPGEHPDPGDPGQGYEMGRALGDLVEALAALPASSGALAAPTYGELHRAHPAMPHPETLCKMLPTDESERRRVGAMIDRLMAEIPSVYEHLPRQFTHGDFVPGNVLMAEGRMTGVFDFEFSAYDLRAMDLTIALGGGPHALRKRLADWDVLESISRGYFSRSRLTRGEIDAVPFLIRLRRVNMLIRFFGRYREGLDSEGFLRGILFWLFEADDWLTRHGDNLVGRLHALAAELA